jgi:tol-pal system protein YbgF
MSMVAMPAAALDRATQERLNNIERKLDSRGLVDMLNRLEQLQQDVQQLRGELEVQTHQLEDVQRRQREQYMDIDRRLQAIETGATGTLSPAPLPGAGNGGVAMTPPVTPPPVISPPAPANTVGPATTPTAPAAAPAVVKAEYETALAILREGRYADAAQAFKQFLARHPTSSYVSNASYWLGETYYVTRDFDQSLTTFTGLVTNFPQSPKVSDSRLKIGYIHYEKKDWKAARQELEGIVSDYPGSTAARLASDRLARMKKEGR